MSSFEKESYSMPDNPFCAWMEAAFFAQVKFAEQTMTYQINIENTPQTILRKNSIGIPTSLILSGPRAGYVITTDRSFTQLSEVGRPLLLSPSQKGTAAVASGKMSSVLKLNPLKTIEIYNSCHNYSGKMIKILEEKKLISDYDAQHFLDNMTTYTQWVNGRISTY